MFNGTTIIILCLAQKKWRRGFNHQVQHCWNQLTKLYKAFLLASCNENKTEAIAVLGFLFGR